MSQNKHCIIWGTPAEVGETNDRNLEVIHSPRAGGDYFIDCAAEKCLKRWADGDKTLLTDWLIEQRRLGVSCPQITSAVLKEVKARRLVSVQERADNLLRYLNHKSDLLGHVVKFYTIDNSNVQDTEYELLAWTGSRKISEVITLAEYCNDQKWIEQRITKRRSQLGPGDIHELMLKPAGYARLEFLGGAGARYDQGFVAMWFNESMDAACTGIEGAIRDSGYEPMRIDKKEHIDKIDDQIIAEIRRSRFVVADFTSQPEKPRGGVYYEAGFAHGLNIPVIWTCRKDLIEHVHFDTRQYNHIIWETPDELRKKLAMRIAAVIGDGPHKSK